MPTPTYDLIASNVLTSSASSVTFSSIPATYRDLVLVMDSTTSAEVFVSLRFNDDTGSNYSFVDMYGNGTSKSSASGTETSLAINYFGSTSNSQASLRLIQIMDYSTTNKHKTVLTRSNQPSKWVEAFAGRWANTSAINKIEIIILTAANFNSGSSFYLYGIVS